MGGPGDRVDEGTWYELLADLLGRAKVAQPDELSAEVNAAAAAAGVAVTIYLVDHEQERLWPLPERGRPTPPPIPVSGTVAGRTFTAVATHQVGGPAGYRFWVPLIDGAERLGVVEVVATAAPADPAELRRHCEVLVGLLGHLVMVKMPYGDELHRVRRTRTMSAAGELLTAMLPPLTFSCRRMVVSAALEPCYDVGGDAFDYAVDGPLATVMVFDAMGRGLTAGLTCAAALSTIRATRRDGHGLIEMAEAADAALMEQFPELRFVTGVLAELDMDRGELRYVNAGHPPPLLLRHGKAVRTLLAGRRLPLGIRGGPVRVGVETLEPGDRLLLYTDGVVEAHDRAGEHFGVQRLVDLAERCAAAQLPSPETLRRLTHSVLEHQDGPPADDATLLLVEWSEAAAERTHV